MSSRQTAQKKREERFNAAMNEFKRGISNLGTYEGAWAFVKAGLRRGKPTRELYARFEAVLMYGHVKPSHWADASQWERQLYAEFDKRRGVLAKPQE